MARPTNAQLAQEFRALLTKGFYCVDIDGERLTGEALDTALRSTKPWRNELWRAFRDIEDRIDPVAAHARAKVKPDG